MAKRMMFKAAVVLITLGYCSLLVFHGSVTFIFQERRPGSVQLSVLSVESIEAVTKPSDVNKIAKTFNSLVTSNNNKNTNATAVKSDKITLDDIFISVKTTKHFQNSRLPIILKTWFELAKNQTWFFTDTDNTTQYQQLTNGHIVNTNCSDSHELEHLCCKTSVEYDHFIASGKKWFCHFDDDNYVNVPKLVDTLQRFNPKKDWYLGRNSVQLPIKIFNKEKTKVIHKFWFATFGAGMCLSKSLALKMIPLASEGRFISVCQLVDFPDDITMGFIIERLVKHRLRVVPEFHSHLEDMKILRAEQFRDQISFSYSKNNLVEVPGFDKITDPTRFLSLHCFLFPDADFCTR